MITLSASGGSVTFEFSGNSTYLNDGQITVPVNSLALIIDESDMATFRKAASNDIFVSANVAEFGMTKAELESWYKANMVGSTGGGGGVTSGEVQTMIDESISGKVDTEDLDISGKTLEKVYTFSDGNDFSGFSLSSITIHYNSNIPMGGLQVLLRAKNASDNWAIPRLSLNANESGITEYYVSETGDVSDKFAFSIVNGDLIATITDNDFKIVSFAYANPTAQQNNLYSFIVPSEIESGSTPSVIEEGVYDTLESLSNSVNALKKSNTTYEATRAYNNSATYPSLSYTTSGITLNYSFLTGGTNQHSSLSTDASIDDDKGVLGVYASGATHSVTLNPETKNNKIEFIPKSNLVFKASLNQSYTGTLPTTNAIQIRYKDFDGDYSYNQGYWDYNSGTDSFSWTTNPSFVNNTGVSMSYDSVSKVLTFTIDPSIVDTDGKFRFTCPRYITPASALTQADCFIGLIEYDTNQYKLQEVLDNKVDTEDLEISGKTIYGVVSSIIQDDVSSKQYKSFIFRLTSKRNITERTLVSFDVYSNGSSVTTVSLYAVVSAADGFTSAYLDNTTYANVAIVDDGMGLLVTFANGYYLGTYTRISSYIQNFQMEFPSIVINSGSTPTVVEQGVYDAIETISDTILEDEKNIATISANTLNALTAASINYLNDSISLSKTNLSGASSTSDLPVDKSLSYHDGKLGVYATGATHTISLNGNYRGTSNYAVSHYSGVVKMYINQSYTGTTPTTRALYFSTNSESGSYTYDSGTDEFTPDGTYTTVSFAYDKTNHLVTFTTLNDAIFSIVGSSGYYAPATALTQENCFIGLVTIDTTSYKLQEALDNKVDTSALGGMTIVKITESAYQSLSVKDPDTLYVVIPDPTNP